jgi:fibro-slime domain-containing protein
MKSFLQTLRNSKGVVMVLAMLILLAVTAVGIGMITSAALSSNIAKNYKFKIQSFYAADGQMTVLAQSVIDSLDTNWFTCGPGTVVGKLPIATATASSVNGSNAAAYAIDGNLSTRWESTQGVDPQWIYVDLGTATSLKSVVIVWENAAARIDTIAGSNNLSTWTNFVTTNSSTGGRTDSVIVSGSYRYVRMWGTTRTTGYGYSIYEMRVYGYLTTCAGSDTMAFGAFKACANIKEITHSKFLISIMAWDSLQQWGKVFKQSLSQYIELGSDTLLTAADSLYAPVTFYDFHSNRTNPEFEQPCLNASPTGKNGMVGTFLDASRKPVLGPSPCMDYNIAKWFRPHLAGDSADSMIPIYHYTTLQYTTVDSQACAKTLRRWRRCSPVAPWGCPVNPGTAGCYGQWGNANANEIDAVADGQNPSYERTFPLTPLNDTAYKNMVFQDSLQFVCINHTTGTYQFSKSGFWPLDGKGFGAEWTAGYQKTNDTACEPNPTNADVIAAGGKWPHNFSFTMTMDRTFVKTPKDTFMFTGDDDIWLFLNNRLVMDLGGPQDGTSETVLVDTCFKHTGAGGTLVPGDTMVNYKTYNFDFFYCERHSTNSNCKITTNMLVEKPVTFTRRSYSRNYGNLN